MRSATEVGAANDDLGRLLTSEGHLGRGTLTRSRIRLPKVFAAILSGRGTCTSR